jgi:trans-aconitate 2-methyltransferase
MRWDPGQYLRYGDERARPFHELVQRAAVALAERDRPPTSIVDLGCGPGDQTATLLDRWPDADILGVDNSPEMIDKAQDYAVEGRCRFVVGDIATWSAAQPVDLIVANAAFHWVPGHVDLLAGFAGLLSSGGVLAFQVPDNFTEPSHVLLRDLRLSPRWRDQLAEGADRTAGVERPARYLDALVDAGLEPDVWQTEYLHILPGDNAVLEWVKGTALRPVLSQLSDPADRDAFLEEYAEHLRQAYPPQSYGTPFPFRRTFAVGRRR